MLYVNNIYITQKELHFCIKISTRSHTKHNVQNLPEITTALTTYFLTLSNLYMSLEKTFGITVILFIIHNIVMLQLSYD